MSKKKNKDVEKKKQNQVQTFSGTGRGMENVEPEDIIIPRVKVMQALSPEVDNYDKISAGDLVDSLTKTKFSNPLPFIPIIFQKTRINWEDRDKGGGILCQSQNGQQPLGGHCTAPSEFIERKTDVKVENPESILNCRSCPLSQWMNNEPPACTKILNFISLLPDENYESWITINFSTTSYKAGRQLISLAKMRRGDLFGFQYYLKTEKVSNDQGTFYVEKVEPGTKVDKGLKSELVQAYEDLQKISYELEAEDLEVGVPNEEDQANNQEAGF